MKNHPKNVVSQILLILLIQLVGISSTQAGDLFLVLEGTISSADLAERQSEITDDHRAVPEISPEENLQASLTQPNSRSERRALDEPSHLPKHDAEEQQRQR